MLKLIPSGGLSVSPDPPPIAANPVTIDSHQVSDYQVSVIATAPEMAPIVWALPLSWKLARLARPDLRMEKGIREWVNYSTAFSNWLYTCLSCFLAADRGELVFPIPDQFIDDLGVRGMAFETMYTSDSGYILISSVREVPQMEAEA